MKYSIVLFLILSWSCQDVNKNVLNQNEIQLGLFDTTFSYDSIVSIDIVSIDHPMLRGIISTKTLSTSEREQFIQILRNLTPSGIGKCINKYVIRIVLTNDTLRLKDCGEKLSGRNRNFFYCLPDSGKIISEFIQNSK